MYIYENFHSYVYIYENFHPLLKKNIYSTFPKEWSKLRETEYV